MADSTRDPLSMDTVGGRGRWVAPASRPARQFLFFPNPTFPGPLCLLLYLRGYPGSRVPRSHSSNLSLNHQLILVFPSCWPHPACCPWQLCPCPLLPPSLLTIYNGGHSLTDAGAIVQLRIKQSGLQKTQGQGSSLLHWYGHVLDRALET
jgi:hypothetical protein